MADQLGVAPLLEVDGLRVRFGPFTAVEDVRFAMRGGELMGLIGPNGAGKTTLLRAIAGLQPSDRGAVKLLGETFGPFATHLRHHVGFTPDTPPVYEEMTVRTFLRFAGMGYGLDPAEAEERIDFWLQKVWLVEKADQKISSLSRGMRQRIGIARTLLPNPSLILLDEPAAGLDPAGRVQFRQLLCDLRDQGKALIVSSHILADMDEYCTHIGIMAGGRMVRCGTVHEVSGHGDATRCRYTVLLARPVPRLEAAIEAIEGVTAVDVDRERVVLEYGSTREEAAELLAGLVRRGVPVASFAANAVDLEEAYLRTGIRQVD